MTSVTDIGSPVVPPLGHEVHHPVRPYGRTTTCAPRAGGEETSLGHAAVDFAALRPRLFALAYRVLGDGTEAEDIVQDAWLRWQRCDRGVVVNPAAFLVTTTTRLALNAAQSARARRETSVGHWASEPVDAGSDPGQLAGRDDALELGIDLVLQKLAPTERAAYVLREAFDYPYARIAELLHRSEVGVRQLVCRAGRHLAAERRCAVRADDRRRLVLAFAAAARGGELEELERVLQADAAGWRPADTCVPA